MGVKRATCAGEKECENPYADVGFAASGVDLGRSFFSRRSIHTRKRTRNTGTTITKKALIVSPFYAQTFRLHC